MTLNRRHIEQVDAPIRPRTSAPQKAKNPKNVSGDMTFSKPFNKQIAHKFSKGSNEETESESKTGDLIKLTVDQKKEVKKLLKDAIDHWKKNSGHHKNLKRWNDLVEGVVEDVDFPWEGASNLHVPLIGIHLTTIHSIMHRSILKVDPLWFLNSLDEGIRDVLPEIEEMLTFKAKSEWNIIDGVSEVIWTTGRDGLGWTQTPYVEELEPVKDTLVIETLDDFTTEFPDAESANMSEKEYNDLIQRIKSEANEENPLEVDIDFNRLVYRGPKIEVIEEADMVRFPMTAREIKDLKVYGKRVTKNKNDIKKMIKDEQVWEKPAEKLIKSGRQVSSSNMNFWDSHRNTIEGISKTDSPHSKEFELYDLNVMIDLDGDGIEEKYMCLYGEQDDILLSMVDYFYRVEIYTDWRYIKRTNRMLAPGIPSMLEDLNAEIDASMNQDINAGTIELNPVFKAKRNANKDFDPQADENRWKPGTVFWLDDPGAFDQMQIRPSDKSISFKRRQEVMRYSEMRVGPTQLLSGQESPVDPNAPGNKTIALIFQSNMRVEDYVNEFRKGFDDIGKICLSHIYQFGTNTVQFESFNREIKEVKRKLLRKDIKVSTHGTNVTDNPQIEFQKALMVFNFLMQDPEIARNSEIKRELQMDVLVAGRVEGRDKKLPSKEDIDRKEVDLREKAIRQILQKEVLRRAGIQAPQTPQGPLNGANTPR